MVRAKDYPPPFRPADFVIEPTGPTDEQIEVGVVIVGAGRRVWPVRFGWASSWR